MIDSVLTPQQKKIGELMGELQRAAIGIRGDWSMFDGRDLLKAVDIWLVKLSAITGVPYSPYYDGGVQGERLKEAFSIDISTWFNSND